MRLSLERRRRRRRRRKKKKKEEEEEKKKKKKKKRRIIRIINGADSIGSSHHRCSVPNNNKRSRFNRVLAPSVLGP